MGLIKQVKCGRCDRTYSSLRSKCPYCGARKNRGGKRSAYSGNGKWQLIAGIIILVAIIVTVVVLIVTSLNSGKTKEPAAKDPPATQTAGEGVTSVTGTPVKPDTTPGTTDPVTTLPATTGTTDPGTQTPPPATATINSITLNREDFTLSKIGEQWQMKATLVPADPGVEVTWKSNDDKVCLISATGLVTAVNKGTTKIVATAGGKSAECIVRVTATASGTTGSTSGTGTGTGTGGGTTSTGTATLSHSDVTISAAKSETFTLSVNGGSGTATYTSGNGSVATVTSSGKVQAISVGITKIKVTVGSQTLECIVRVI